MVKLKDVGDEFLKVGAKFTIGGTGAFIIFAILGWQMIAVLGLSFACVGMLWMSIGTILDSVHMSKQKVGSIQPHAPEEYK